MGYFRPALFFYSKRSRLFVYETGEMFFRKQMGVDVNVSRYIESD